MRYTGVFAYVGMVMPSHVEECIVGNLSLNPSVPFCRDGQLMLKTLRNFCLSVESKFCFPHFFFYVERNYVERRRPLGRLVLKVPSLRVIFHSFFLSGVYHSFVYPASKLYCQGHGWIFSVQILHFLLFRFFFVIQGSFFTVSYKKCKALQQKSFT